MFIEPYEIHFYSDSILKLHFDIPAQSQLQLIALNHLKISPTYRNFFISFVLSIFYFNSCGRNGRWTFDILKTYISYIYENLCGYCHVPYTPLQLLHISEK